MTQPPGHYGPPGGGYGGDPYGQSGGGYGDPYGQPSGPPGYGQPSGPPPAGYGDPYGQPSGPPAGYGDPYGQPGYGDPYGQPSGPPAGYGQPGYGAPGSGMPPPVFPPTPPKKSNTGLIIGLVAGVLVLLLCGGGTLVYLMNRASTPTEAVEGFMDAAFTDRDLEAAKEFVCEEEVGSMTNKYDETFGGDEASFSASWSNAQETSNDGTNAEVTLDVKMSVTYQGHTTDVSGTWTFDLVDESGWKVCELRPSTS